MPQIEWQSKFKASETDAIDGLSRMVLKGVLIDTSCNKNAWQVEEEDFKILSKDFIGKQLRVDHGEHVQNVLGRVVETEIDSPHEEAKSEWDIANPNPHIHFTAEIATKDNNLIVPIKMGFVDFVSPSVDAGTILCSICRTPMIGKNTKQCSCEKSALLLKNLSARELSLVASPAYEKTVAKVYGFSAAVDNSIKNMSGDNMVNENRIENLEAAVSNLIARFAAEEEKKEEIIPKEEEEVKKAEEEEAKPMVPISKVAEEKEEKEEEEEKVKKLEAMVAQLIQAVSQYKAGITPETPEDEPKDVKHKIPKVSNEPVPSKKPKEGEKLFDTPAMHPGKLKAMGSAQGVSFNGSIGSTLSKDEVEQKAVEEIFGFAASRGTTPVQVDYRIKTIKV